MCNKLKDELKILTKKLEGIELNAVKAVIAEAGELPDGEKEKRSGVLMADALAGQGVSVTYLGNGGRVQEGRGFINGITSPYTADISDREQKHKAFINRKNGLQNSRRPELRKAMADADIIALENWSLGFFETAAWKDIFVETFSDAGERKPLFIDMTNPEKGAEGDICEALRCVGKFNRDFSVMLELSKEELSTAVQKMGICNHAETGELAAALRERLGIEILIIHNALFSLAVSEEEKAYVEMPQDGSSRRGAEAAADFNAGFLLGEVCDFSLKEALYLAAAGSGFLCGSMPVYE